VAERGSLHNHVDFERKYQCWSSGQETSRGQSGSKLGPPAEGDDWVASRRLALGISRGCIIESEVVTRSPKEVRKDPLPDGWMVSMRRRRGQKVEVEAWKLNASLGVRQPHLKCQDFVTKLEESNLNSSKSPHAALPGNFRIEFKPSIS
jgi:hypothetical protein